MNVSLPRLLGSADKMQIMHHLQSFLRFGGFPEAIGTSVDVHRSLLQTYTSTVIYRDIVDRYGVRNTHVLRHLLTHCLRNSATIFSINKMYNTLKSMGCEIGRGSLYEFMDYFEDAYCVFSLHKFDRSFRKSDGGRKKAFAVDQGLITSVTLSSDFDLAAQLETAVFAALRRLSEDIYYYHGEGGKEVDFVLLMPDQSMHLFQVSVTLKDPATRRREVRSLAVAMDELGLNAGTIITLDEEEEIPVAQGTIKVVPVWKLFLESEI